MYNLVDLTDKKIIVTGASQGIGKDTAILLSKLGATVILVARNEENLKSTLEQLEGEGHKYYLLDISNLDDIEPCVKNIVSECGAVDGLVYSAGISNSYPLNLMKPKNVLNVLKINLLGFLEFIRCISKKKNYNVGMRIVGISSTAAFIATKCHTAYASSKAGMNGAVRCLALELADKGIAINTVAPGMIATDMYKGYIQKNGEDSEGNQDLLNRQYLGIGETKDVASAIAFLISPAAKFITGICMPIDGGSTSC